jgi:hypothetical protein
MKKRRGELGAAGREEGRGAPRKKAMVSDPRRRKVPFHTSTTTLSGYLVGSYPNTI